MVCLVIETDGNRSQEKWILNWVQIFQVLSNSNLKV